MRIGLVYGLSTLLPGLVLGLAACSDDEQGPADAAADSGVHPSDAGGVLDAGAGIDGGSRGMDAAIDAANSDYQCVPPALPSGTVASDEACCSGLGTCRDLGDAGASLGFGDCNASANLRCVPRTASVDAGMSDGGTSLVASCRMKIGSVDAGPDYEGRCIPECLTRGQPSLTQGECTSGFVCVPCYNPVTGIDTGACRSGGDHPAEAAPAGFPECGDATGYCVSSGLVQGGTTLPQLTCPAGELCAPKLRVTSPNACFAHCDSIAGAGACIPAFLVPESSRGVLQSRGCMTGELCTPCISPLDQKSTGACD